MKKPSIDRKDNDGNYTLENCQFIEMNENGGKDKRKIILQFDLDGNFIKEWESIISASKFLKRYSASIVRALKKQRRTAYGFIWRYKNDN